MFYWDQIKWFNTTTFVSVSTSFCQLALKFDNAQDHFNGRRKRRMGKEERVKLWLIAYTM